MSLSQAMRKLLSCLKQLGELAKSYFSCCSRPCIYHRGISPRNRETLRGQAMCVMSSQHPNCMKKVLFGEIPPFKTTIIKQDKQYDNTFALNLHPKADVVKTLTLLHPQTISHTYPAPPTKIPHL